MKGVKKGVCWLLICSLSLCLTGCWDSTEINGIAIVSAVALDKSDDGQILMSMLITNPGKISSTVSGSEQKSSTGQATILLSEKGTGVLDIYQKIQAKLPKVIYLSHLRVIVIGQDLAKEGVSGILDFFTRYRESHLRTEVVITKDKAVDLFKINTEYEKLPSESIRKKTQLVLGSKSTLLKFFNNITEEGIEAQVPEFETGPFESDSDSKDNEKQNPAVVFKGTAVFKNDKLLGFLDDQKLKGVVNFNGSTKLGCITIPIPKEKGGGFVSLRIPESSTNISPMIQNDKLEADVTIKIEGRIFENESKLDLSDSKVISYIESLFKDTLNQNIKPLLNTVQKDFNSDIYGFGAAFHRKYPEKWNAELKTHWDETFRNLPINLNYGVTISYVGFLTKSLGIEEKALIK
ncbi:Ger(x)C family spore germination protein [Caproiciproducens faecalis]|uniref:Ger(X)C family spore germination protein n=1 Tax=Caproiciproducens faecalis TaxID=2820301 RepID=A0ABS7DNA4_9FIRM|nr:Ger(x)C family spore germination protein [Caproiciproducens faecalis]MBW7572011.1 Ger(x)C family spore germination protein [Caproiciproducens faecalis]